MKMIEMHVARSTPAKSAVWQQLWMVGAQQVTVMTKPKPAINAKQRSVTKVMRMIRWLAVVRVPEKSAVREKPQVLMVGVLQV